MTADLQNCSKSLQTENQSQLGGLGTLTQSSCNGRKTFPDSAEERPPYGTPSES